MLDNEIVLTVADVAEMLGCSKTWVHVLRQRQRLRPVARTRRGVYLYDFTEIERVRLDRERRGLARRSSMTVSTVSR